jgi:multidrug efflux pump subunit AcrA (membrane-fusion protein)
MLKSRFAKLGAAGFAAAAGMILIAASVGAHHSTAPTTLSSITGLVSTTAQVGTEVDQDAAAEAAALTAAEQAEAAKEAAEKAAEQQQAAAEAAEDAADTETGDTETETETETGDHETGVQSGDDSSETGTGTKTAPKSGD